ncbi:MAG: hypothetical protein A3D99_01065 [Candidatus Andersenbacteria bacterium RIFCSPHIGHO2_12_FULL_45_11]|uniref:Uncharacterized protein n=1 Tax=Candidatus Andersenbacteria bacterium RIFCSPHIGHO2_12_FULL_45_11 TaxID=1797281 RepID=A0A1G1X7E8_9BACT|nr:MAG: hypothetical protein A3D99_01065 [Candidatus Andersenbacteria bacterium RIFCSPHIGHO2_12_FULL_45_11]
MIHVITDKATPEQIKEMAQYYELHIKVAVDLTTSILAGGGEWHADCEKVLLEQGSTQENVWGGGYMPGTKMVDFYSLINIRPKQDNPDQDILSKEIRQKFEKIVRDRLEL